MRVLIVTPAELGSTKGNRITAERWGKLLLQSGHEVFVGETVVDGDWECLITLHATRSAGVISKFQQQFVGAPVILCLTGTDLHRDMKRLRGAKSFERANWAIQNCNRVVLLEPQSMAELVPEVRRKAVVILQSAVPVELKPEACAGQFEICVVGHLRAEKDPFLAAQAMRLLPDSSKIVVSHLGAALTSEFPEQARREMELNHRYRWLGGLSHADSQKVLARSKAMVLSSVIEGAPSVISEAIVNGIPILATRITATIGLLGGDYPGLFPVRDADALAGLMNRAETDSEFYSQLISAAETLAPSFVPDVERQQLNQLVLHARSDGFS